nr:MAG: hypothetical protein E4H34_05295 [Hyphomicrobiales bacterium]
MTKPKRLPLPKRFNVAMTEKAYARLRGLNGQWHLGNNYLLTVLLENLDEIADGPALERAFERFIAEYGAPSGEIGMK